MGAHVKMPCGWGCGEEFGARYMAAHFSRCSKRPGSPRYAADQSPSQVDSPAVEQEAFTPTEERTLVPIEEL